MTERDGNEHVEIECDNEGEEDDKDNLVCIYRGS